MKKVLRIALIVVLLGLAYVIYANYPRLNIIAGYSAKNMNSSVFLAHRGFKYTDETDNNFTPVKFADDTIDTITKTTESSVFHLLNRKAVYRDGLGSVLIPKNAQLPKSFAKPNRIQPKLIESYPYGNGNHKDTIFLNIDYKLLEAALDSAFDNKNQQNTRAVLVIYKNHIVAERYASGFDKHSLFLGWSMAKSITGTLFGILQYQGKLDINNTPKIPEWQHDDRSKITIRNLLNMNSGLAWEENYETISDVTKMLFMTDDMTKTQIEKKMVGKPDSSWNYSSGTSNLLSGVLRHQFKTHQEYLDFWYTALIDKIGMYSMVVETDFSGNYVGSSYAWATARDWGKFGLLYLNKGNYNGEQLFDKKWIDFVTTPTPTSDGKFGGHFWLNVNGQFPDAPKDMFSANGYQGQRVFILPSQDMVIVRLGLTNNNSFDTNAFLKRILTTVKVQ